MEARGGDSCAQAYSVQTAQGPEALALLRCPTQTYVRDHPLHGLHLPHCPVHSMPPPLACLSSPLPDSCLCPFPCSFTLLRCSPYLLASGLELPCKQHLLLCLPADVYELPQKSFLLATRSHLGLLAETSSPFRFPAARSPAHWRESAGCRRREGFTLASLKTVF